MKNISKPAQGISLIAVDPSITATGLAMFTNDVLKSVYLIKTKTGTDRLKEIAIRTKAILDKYNPTVMAIETQYLAVRSNAVIKVIEVKGLIEGLFIGHCLDRKVEPIIVDVTPMEAKNAVGVGGGLKRKDSKAAVKKMVTMLFPALRDESQDVMDSVAIGIAGEAMNRINNMF